MEKEIDYNNKEKSILNILTEAYIFILIIVFPLIVDSTGFFKILECKYRAFLVISIVYIVASAVTLIYFLLFHNTRFFKNVTITKTQYAVLFFWVINVISTIVSPFKNQYNLLVGVGRGEGLITISLYCFTFLFISFFGRFKKRYITYFSISSILINTIAILQYIGFNPFNMYQDGIGTHNVSFMATIGNIDFISALYCILLTISFCAFVFLDQDIKHKIIHLLSVFMGFFIFIIINVLSGRVAFLLTFVILFPFIITNSKRLARTIICFSSIILGLAINIVINPRYHYDIGKLTLDLQFNEIVLSFIIIIVVFVFLAYMLYKNEYNICKKKIIIGIYATIILLGIIMVGCLYFIEFNSGTLYEVHELLHGNFDDDFGTYRVFLWKRAFSIFPEYPILGSGPDTFAIRFMSKFTEDVIALGELSINDTAGNVYITMLINIGLIGAVSYLGVIVIQIIDGIKKLNKFSIILLVAIMCFWIQDMFNLWVVIVTPVFWTLMGIHTIAINEEINIEKGGKTSEEEK